MSSVSGEQVLARAQDRTCYFPASTDCKLVRPITTPTPHTRVTPQSQNLIHQSPSADIQTRPCLSHMRGEWENFGPQDNENKIQPCLNVLKHLLNSTTCTIFVCVSKYAQMNLLLHSCQTIHPQQHKTEAAAYDHDWPLLEAAESSSRARVRCRMR